MKPRLTKRRPAATSASITRRQASAVVASGFSHRTGLPAAMHAITNSSCVVSNDATTTASTSGSAISACGSAIARAPRLARGRVRAGEIRVGDGGDVRALHGRGERRDVGRAHHPRPDDADADAHVTYCRCVRLFCS